MTVLLLGDITGRSRVALRMLSRVLEDLGHEVLMLPTAMISNTLNLGAHAALDTTDYLLKSLAVWEKLGMRYDMAYIGYITGMEQAERLAAIADGLRAKGVPLILDPILGDSGKRYNSVTDGQMEGMKLLCTHAELITPNLTEACVLAGADYAAAERGEGLAQRIDAQAEGRSAVCARARASLGHRRSVHRPSDGRPAARAGAGGGGGKRGGARGSAAARRGKEPAAGAVRTDDFPSK